MILMGKPEYVPRKKAYLSALLSTINPTLTFADVYITLTQCPNDTLVSKKEKLHVDSYYYADVRFALLDARGNKSFFYLP